MAGIALTTLDLPVGAHQSVASGTPRAVDRGGEAGCRVVQILTDPRLASIPKFLETPKDETLAHDGRNVATLRRLAGEVRHSS